MNEFLQASFIATGLTTFLGAIFDDFYLKNGEIKGATRQKRIANNKKQKQLKKAWDEGEILEGIILRFFQNLVVLPMLFLLYRAEVDTNARDWIICFMMAVLSYLMLNSKSQIQLFTILIIFLTITILVVKNIICQNVYQQYIIAVIWLIGFGYGIYKEKMGKWQQIIESFLKFEVKEYLVVMLIYIILYMVDILIAWELSIGIRVLIVLACVQIFIPINKVWGEVLE